jgi:hypothetical protein
MQGKHSLTIENVNACLEICRQEGFEDIEAANLAMLAMPHFWQLDFEAVDKINERLLPLAKKQKAARAEAVSLIGVSILSRERMAPKEAELAAFQSHAIFGRLRARPMQAAAYYWAIRARRLQSDKSLDDLVSQARDLIEGSGNAAFNPQVRVLLALAEANRNGVDAAMDKAEEKLADIQNPTRAMWSYDDIIEEALLHGDFPRAARLANGMLERLPEKLPWADVLAEMSQLLVSAPKANPELDAMDARLLELGWTTKAWVFSQARKFTEGPAAQS